MDKLDPTIKIIEVDDKTEVKPRGDNLDQAPQPALTAPDNSTIATLTAGENTTLANYRQRILDLENALVRLGLLKSR